MKKPLDPGLASILDSIRATLGSDEVPPPAADAPEAAAAPAPAASPAPPAAPQRTVEAFLADLIRPHLKSWLDAHLPELVQKITAEEIARLIERGPPQER